MVSPCGTSVGVGGTEFAVGGNDVGVGISWMAVGDGLDLQPFKVRERMVARRNSEVALLIVLLHQAG